MKDCYLKHTRAYFSSPEPAEPRNLTNEMLQTLRGYQQTAPGFLELERQIQPGYGQLSLDNQAQSMFGFTDEAGVHHPGSLELQRFGTQFQRAGDISDVEQFGPASTQAFLAANPYLRTGLDSLRGRIGDSDILRTLNAQANAGLASGGELTPQEQRALEQQTRSAYSDRGNYQGNQAIGAELLNRDAAVRARQQQAQALAGQVEGMNQAQNDFTGRATQIFGTTLSDPFQAILGRSSGSGSSGGGASYPQQIGSGSRLFDPLNPYAEDLYNSNMNSEASNNIAQANAQNAQASAYASAAASLLGALISDKRMKKNVKKTGEKTEEGVDIVEFEYKTDPKKRRYRAVMAQDQEKVNPDSILEDPLSGLKLIKYDETKAPFQEIRGKGKKAKYFNLITGELEEKAA